MLDALLRERLPEKVEGASVGLGAEGKSPGSNAVVGASGIPPESTGVGGIKSGEEDNIGGWEWVFCNGWCELEIVGRNADGTRTAVPARDCACVDRMMLALGARGRIPRSPG